MEKLIKIANDIESIFEIVCVISDEKELFFENFSVLHDKLILANNLISNIKLDPIIEEIWEFSSFPDRDNQIVNLVNDKFNKLITWKPNTVSIMEMNNKLMDDLKKFYNRQACIEHEYNPYEQSFLNPLYKEIGQRAYKLDSELAEIMNYFYERGKNELMELGYISEHFTFKLNPEKMSDFAHLLVKMHENKFFIATNKDEPLTDLIVLYAFGELFNCDLMNKYMDIYESDYIPMVNFGESNYSESTIIPISETSDFTGKPFPEYLLHPEKIKLAELIRKEISKEKGKKIRIFLAALEQNNAPLITIGYRQAKDIYKSMTDYFSWDIGSYQSVFNYKIDFKNDQIEIDKATIRLNHILNTFQR
ncbi:MAG: hypothetical protein ACOYMD_11785 [Paludibacter sp.]